MVRDEEMAVSLKFFSLRNPRFFGHIEKHRAIEDIGGDLELLDFVLAQLPGTYKSKWHFVVFGDHGLLENMIQVGGFQLEMVAVFVMDEPGDSTGPEGFVEDWEVKTIGLIDDILDIPGLEMNPTRGRIINGTIFSSLGGPFNDLGIIVPITAPFGRGNRYAAIE